MHFATAGSRFFIGEARPGWKARPAEAKDFASAAWTEIRHLTNLGRLGGDWMTEDTTSMGNGDVAAAMKLAREAVDMEVVADIDTSDAGQLALIAAESSRDCFPFRIVFRTGAERLFIAFVFGLAEIYDEANTVTATSTRLRLQSTVVRN